MQRFKKRIYLFSGLGADHRVFQLLDFSKYSVTFIDWIIPKETDTLETYCKKLTSQIQDKRPILVGLSFGGIIAVEVAKQIETEKIVLIASAKRSSEIPFYFRILGFFRINKIIPVSLLKTSNFLTFWFFGAKTEYEKKLLRQILQDTNAVFLQWAINQIVNWKNKEVPKNLIHIHGTADKILPIQFIKADKRVNTGGHFMTLNQVEVLNKLLSEAI